MADARFALLVAMTVLVVGCNTAQGVKKDVAIGAEKTGEAVQKVVD